MKLYYAHCKAIYDTPQEFRDIELLKGMGFEVVNPNTPEHHAAAGVFGMPYFHDVVRNCDGVAFRANPDGSISCGVAQEIAWNLGRPLIELPSGVLRRALTLDQTREFLREIGER